MASFAVVQASDYSDSVPAESVTLGVSTCTRPFVHGVLRMTCDGPTLKLRIMGGYGIGSGTNEARIAIYVDGAYSTNVLPTTSDTSWYTATIPSGNHLVEVQATQQTGGSYPVISGTWVDAVSAPNLKILPPTAAAACVVFSGDSINDSLVSVSGQTDFVSLFRVGYAARGRTINYSWGFRGMHTESATYALQAAAMDRATRGASQIRYVCTLGTNDYGLNLCSAAQYGTDYAAHIAAVKAQWGGRLQQIYVVTSFPRQVETANGSGNTLTQYRTQAAAQAGTGVTVIDGTSLGLVGPTDYTDSPWLHPADTGHAKIATSFLSTFGGP